MTRTIDMNAIQMPVFEARTTEEVPVEDYNEENDYSFGMKQVLRICAFLVGVAFIILIANTAKVG